MRFSPKVTMARSAKEMTTSQLVLFGVLLGGLAFFLFLSTVFWAEADAFPLSPVLKAEICTACLLAAGVYTVALCLAYICIWHPSLVPRAATWRFWKAKLSAMLARVTGVATSSERRDRPLRGRSQQLELRPLVASERGWW